MYSILFLACTAFISCYLLTPLIARWSHWTRLLDTPNAGRKQHLSPMPRLGGVAVAFAYVAAVGLLMISGLNGAQSVQFNEVLALLPAVGLVFGVGLIDDVKG